MLYVIPALGEESRFFFVMLNKFAASLVVDPEINSG
jgi:hypothetical protein